MAASRLEFRILGPLVVRVDGAPVPVGGPKQRALLALLLLSANRVVSRERLIGELFAGQSGGGVSHGRGAVGWPAAGRPRVRALRARRSRAARGDETRRGRGADRR